LHQLDAYTMHIAVAKELEQGEIMPFISEDISKDVLLYNVDIEYH